MRPRFVLALLATLPLTAPFPVGATPPEDEAHRLDRLETRRLNEAAAARLAPRAAPAAPAPVVARAPATKAPPTAAEQALRLREEQAIAGWRRERAACGGDAPC